ncbi:hypothetical protein ACIGEZ_14375 [Streptomyces sp. NPDC085481]|uniref:hypothetical protein n=1 Tax=Streptomyces sp. NPDC085481 TaxID=3365727 RepID=UPI0037CE0C26
MTDRPAGARPASERTDNEISGGSQVGGNAYQARNIHFGGRSIGLTVVALALVAALTGVVALTRDGEGPGQPVAKTQTPSVTATASSGSPSPNPTPTASTTPSSAPPPAAPAQPGPRAKATPKVKAATDSRAFEAGDLYCGDWRTSWKNLRVASCVRVDTAASSATFGIMVRNVGTTQVVARALVQIAGLGAPECPLGRYETTGLVINPGGTWFSDLGKCGVGGLNGKHFQTVGSAIEDPEGNVDIQNATVVHSIHPALSKTGGGLTCLINGKWTACDSYAYPLKP